MNLCDKKDRLHQILRSCRKVAIGFSGGVDSTFLLRSALDALGAEQVLAIIADSVTLPRRELREALALAEQMGATCRSIKPREFDLPAFVNNTPERCYHCKLHLFTLIRELAHAEGYTIILDGSNLDDLDDYRPGTRALKELGVRSPLIEAALSKAEIRILSERLNLPTASKPALACLATRIPCGEPITPALLARIEAAEELLHRAGLTQCRVRHHGRIARLELLPAEFEVLLKNDLRLELDAALKALGYDYITLDLLGYRPQGKSEPQSE